MTKRKPERSHQLWLFGTHSCHAALNNPDRVIQDIWCLSPTQVPPLLSPSLATKVKIVDRRQMDSLFPPGTVHQGIAVQTHFLAAYELDDLARLTDINQIVVVLDQVTDPHNVGAILRSSAVFGVKAVLMTDRGAPAESGVLAKSASGALERVPLIRETNLAKSLQTLKEMGYWCVGLSEHAPDSLTLVDLKGKIALILGAEGDGMRRLTKESCDYFVTLPTAGSFSTLNVSNAAAIVLYATFMQQFSQNNLK